MSKVLLTYCLFGLLTLVSGCVEPHRDPALAKIEMPADFGLELTVHGKLDTADPMLQPARYVLEPNRRLRALVGELAETRSFPRIVRVLTPADYEAIYHLIDEAHLFVEPTSPGAELLKAGKPADSPTLYQVRIYAKGKAHHYATTPVESPPTIQLHARLAELAVGPGSIRPPTSRPAETQTSNEEK